MSIVSLIGIFFISPFWGMTSTWLFLQSWVSFFVFTISIIGLIRGKVARKDMLGMLGVSIAQAILFSALLTLGEYVLTNLLGFGYTRIENIVYWVFAVPSFLYVLLQIPGKLKKNWQLANTPGFLEDDFFEYQVTEAYNRAIEGASTVKDD